MDGPELGRPIPPPPGFLSAVPSPRSDRLIIASSDDPTDTRNTTLTLWDTTTAEPIVELDDPLSSRFAFTVARFSFDGDRVVLYNGLAHAIFDATTGEELSSHDDSGYAALLGEQRIVVRRAGDIGIVDVDGEPAGPTMVGHTERTVWLSVSPDGARLATTSADGTTRVWDLSTGEQIGRSIPIVGLTVADWSPDGTTLAVPRDEGLELWNFDTDT